ncbi:RDD family protein [Anaerobacillus sp. MEB173]|uniref:RDD family protein n=1 Tax=Anaerobacillus sp. MEB173 TaxID=3383345 RepID=UPI003F8FAE1F
MEVTYDEQEKLENKADDLSTSRTIRFAGFWMRFWAYLLDLVVVFSLNGILAYPVLRWLGIVEVEYFIFSIEALITALVGYVYFMVMTKYGGQTLGKKVFGLKVVGKENDQLSWSTVIFRELIGKFISQTLLFIGYLIVAFSKKKQGAHDWIADTYVIHEE